MISFLGDIPEQNAIERKSWNGRSFEASRPAPAFLYAFSWPKGTAVIAPLSPTVGTAFPSLFSHSTAFISPPRAEKLC